MIKILFFIETLTGGGAEKVLRTLVNNMDQTRFDITVMTVWPEDAKKYLSPGIHYRALYATQSKLNRLRYRIEAALGLCYPLHIKFEYDIEVAYLECGATKIMAGSTNKKALKLAWVHCDLKKKTSNAEAFVRKCKPWYQKFDKVVCVSQTAKESYEDLFENVSEAVVLYNVNDESDIINKACEKSHHREAQPLFATVGRLSYEKGIDRLLDACKKLKVEGYNFCCWIIGDGPERQKLETMAADLGLGKIVRFFGYQNNPYPYIRTADVIVCPSRFEGFSTVVTESLILGKPVVATPCSGMQELLGNSECGIITEDSAEGIFSGMKTLMDSPKLREVYEQRARERGKAFSKRKILEQTEAFLCAELEKKR